MKEWFDQSKTTTTPCGSMSGIWRCLGDHLGFVGFEKLHAFSSAAYGIRDFCLGLTILHACTFLWWTLHSMTFKISIATSVSPPASCNCSLGHFCRSSDPATNVWASVALWNCGVRPHQPLNPPIFHTSTIWMALTSSAANSGWNFAPLDISHSTSVFRPRVSTSLWGCFPQSENPFTSTLWVLHLFQWICIFTGWSLCGAESYPQIISPIFTVQHTEVSLWQH